MIKHLLLAAGLLLAGCSSSTTEKPAAGAWQPFAVDKRLTVQLPTAAKELDAGLLENTAQYPARTRAWMARAPEGLCVVMRMPIGNVQRIEQQDTAQRRLFCQAIVRGALAADERPRLLKHTCFQIANGNGAEIMYVGWDANASKRRVRYMRSLLLDSIAYNLIFRPADKLDTTGTAGTAQRRRFFDSITVRP